ncbi:pilin [Ramlibacter sp. WS9]|nr:pilin [Ramlibacter sp. WS9]
MVVIAVMAILALIALPTYVDKLAREQIAEALPLADIAKPPVAAAWSQSQPLPADNAAAGLPPPEKIVSTLVSSVTMQEGVIHIRFGNSANRALKGKTLSLRPAGVEDARMVPVAWICAKAAVPDKMTVTGADRTDIPVGLLPMRCR